MADKPKVKQDPLTGLQEFIKKLNKNERMLAYIAGFFILLVILDRVILAPITGRIKVLDEEIGQEVSRIKDGLMILGYKDMIEKEYDGLKTYFAAERKTQEEELAEFLKELENLAGESGVYLVTISPSGNVEEGKAYTKYEIKLECTGAMEQITKFAYSISSSPKPTKVQTFEITPPAKGAQNLKCSMTVSRMLVSV